MDRNIKTLRWVIKTLFKAFPFLIISFALIQIFIAIIPLLENYYFSRMIDSLISYSKSSSDSWIKVFTSIVLIRAAMIFVYNFQKYLIRIFGFKNESYLRKLFNLKIASLDYQHLEDKDTANLIAKVREEYQWRFREVFTVIFEALVNISALTGSIFIIAPRYWYFIPLIVLAEIPGFIVDKNFTTTSFKFFNENTLKLRQSNDLSNYLTSKTYLPELHVNQSTEFLINKFIHILDFFEVGRVQMRRDKLPRDISTSLLSLGILTFVLLVVIKDIQSGIISVGMFTFYYSALRQLGNTFSSLIFNYTTLSEHSMYLENFKNILELKNKIEPGIQSLNQISPPTIEFKHVYFKYPNSKNYVFQDLNLTIKPGEEIAIVGINGAGKSTLIKLLCRFYDPNQGEILVNGIDLKNLQISNWHQHLAVLFQEFTKYPSLSLKDNVIISAHTSKTQNIKIKSALAQADAEFTQKFPKGLNTMMSQRYGGEEPSWGQWQKIAISRIFYRDAPIMILDEPTASIDAVSESKIFNNLYKNVVGKTVIIVSHRFSTVRNAQRIIVIDKGSIVEEGSHEELVHLGGRYAESFKLQALGYQNDNKENQEVI